MPLDSNRSSSVENCTFVKTVLMMLVILYHSCAFWTGGWLTVQTPEVEAEILGFFSTWINSFHVYAFTLVSGFLFSYLKWEKQKYQEFKPFLINKIKRLLIPYVVTSAVWAIPIGQAFYHYDLPTLINKYVLATAPSQLWFLLMLFWCFIGAWCLSERIENNNCFSVLITIGSFGVGSVCGLIIPNFFCVWSACQYFPLFVLGMKIRQRKWTERIPIGGYIVTDIVLFAIWFVAQNGESTLMKLIAVGIGLFLHIVGALMAWSVLQWVGSRINWKENTIFMALSRCAMPMYLLHQQLIYFTILWLNGQINPYLHAGINFITALISTFLISHLLMQWKFTRMLVGEK